MLRRIRSLLQDEEPRVPAAPRAEPALLCRPQDQRVLCALPFAAPPWDSGASEALELYVASAEGREHDLVALLVERLTGARWEEHARAPFVDAQALPLLLSPSLLLRLSPSLAITTLALVARGVDRRAACGETCRDANAAQRLLLLLSLLGDEEAYALPDALEAHRVQLAEASLECLVAVLTHHTAPEDVSAALKTLHSARGRGAGWLQPRLLRALIAASCSENPTPRSAFLLHGPAAGLAVEVAHSATRTGALTLLLWLRVESPPSSQESSIPVFSLFSESGLSGVCAAISLPASTLLLRSVAGGRATTQRTQSLPLLVSGRWLSLCLVLTRATLLSDSVNIYLDGALGASISLPFPSALAEGTPQTLHLGCWPPAGTPGVAPGASLPPPALQGQMGGVALFAVGANADEVAALHAASAQGAPLVPPASALSDRKTRGVRGATGALLPARLAEKGHRRLMLALDPRACDASGQVWGAATRVKRALCGTLLPGTRCLLRTSFADAAAACGGPLALLPLFLSANTRLTPPPCEDVSSCLFPALVAQDVARLLPLPGADAGLPPGGIAQALLVLPHLLSSCRPGEASAFVRCLATLMRCAEPQEALLTPQLAGSLLEVVRALDAVGCAGARDGGPDWEPAAVLLLDVPLWRRSGPVARKAHLGAVRAYLEGAEDGVTASFAGEFLLNSLRADQDHPDAADERLALLRIVQAFAEAGHRPGVRGAVSRQLVRFVHAAAAGGVHLDVLLSCAQLLVAILARDLNAQAADGRAPHLPPLVREPGKEGMDLPADPSCLQLLQTGGGLLGAALSRRLATHPSLAVSSLGKDLRAAVFIADAADAAAADAVLVYEPSLVAGLLAGSPSGASARACAGAAQAWCGGRGGRAHAYRLLRLLATTPGAWCPAPHTPEAAALSASLPWGRPYWRLEDGASPDGARRRLLPLERDASCAAAARGAHHAQDAAASREPLTRQVAALPQLPRTVSGAASALHQEEEDMSALEETHAADDFDADAVELLAFGHDGHVTESDGEEDCAEAGQTGEPSAPEQSALSVPDAMAPGHQQTQPTLSTPQLASSFAPPPQFMSPMSPLQRVRARAVAAASGMVARAAQALDAAKEASSTVALAQEIVVEQLTLVQAFTGGGLAATSPPLPPWALHPRGMPREAVSFSVHAEWLRPDAVRPGMLLVAAGHLAFVPDNGEGGGLAWPLARLASLQLRRRHMRRSGLEAFLADGTSALFHLPAPAGVLDDAPRTRPHALHAAILRQRPLCSRNSHARSLLPPLRLVERAGWTRAWQRREMSNFEYLMRLNGAAGRSYHDLSQYPVFPWVLADYTSDTLDLSNPASYRDLSRPMGAQIAARREAACAFYDALDDPDIPSFHHGSHYSTPGGVLHLLMRLEPFAALHVALQSGCFDHADRLLLSVQAAWRSATSSSSDVKELVPEWFCMPDAFRNGAALPLGSRQDGTPVDDVLLPPWARGSAEEFVRLHRAALESDHVSAHLPAWIDLIFGHKQHGPAATEALNCFYYTCYEGEVDTDRLKDERTRSIFLDQVTHFGQTPMMLFREPHPARGAGEGPENSAALALASAGLPGSTHEGRSVVAVAFPPFAAHVSTGVLFTVDAAGRVLTFKLPPRGSKAAPSLEALDGVEKGRESLGPALPFGWAQPASTHPLTSRACAAHLVAVAPELGGLLAGGFWDGSVLAFGRDLRGRARPALRVAQLAPSAACTCIAYQDGILAAGASDGCVCVWRAPSAGGGTSEPERPALTLRGHAAPVTALAICVRTDTLAAGAADGRCLLFALGSGALVRALPSPSQTVAVAALAISPLDGCVAIHGLARPHAGLTVWTSCGRRVAQIAVPAPLLALAFTPCGRALFTASQAEGVTLRAPNSLEPVAALVLPAGTAQLSAAALTPDGGYLVIGCVDGSLSAHRTPPVPR